MRTFSRESIRLKLNVICAMKLEQELESNFGLGERCHHAGMLTNVLMSQ